MKLRTIVIGGAILSVVLGFTLGKTVIADAPAPGSSADPLASKSYVDKAMQDRINGLEKTVAELTVQSQALQNTINELQAKINKTPVKTTPPATGGTATTPAAPPPATTTPDNSLVGKTAYAIGSSIVNVRSSASQTSSIVTKVTKNDPLTIQQVKDSWYQVKLANGTTGWVANWVVEVK